MKPSGQRIPISAAREISEKYGYDQVVIYARLTGDDGKEHVTTYGKDKTHCGIAASIGDHLKYKVFGWVRTEKPSSFENTP